MNTINENIILPNMHMEKTEAHIGASSKAT